MGATKTLPDGTVVPDEILTELRACALMDGGTMKGEIFFDMQFVGHKDKECPNCHGPHGSGMLHAATGEKVTIPYHFGGSFDTRPPYSRRMKAYPCPVCATESYRAILRSRCGVEDNEATASTEIWEVAGREQMIATVNGALSEWTNNHVYGWLTIVGPYGSGKTKLAQVTVRRAVESNISARYILAHDLGQFIMSTVTDDSKTPEEVLEPFRRAQLLVIDQLDWLRQKTNKGDMTMVIEHLLAFLDHRYRERQDKATVLVLNHDWYTSGGGELAPIVSRAAEGWVAITDIGNLRDIAGQVQRDQFVMGRDDPAERVMAQ
jgi:hypothetical protein